MTEKITRKAFLKRAAAIGIGAGITYLPLKFSIAQNNSQSRKTDKEASAFVRGDELPNLKMSNSEFRIPNSKFRSRVTVALDEAVRDSNGAVVQIIVDKMLENSMKKLMDTGNGEDAWRQLFKPTDIVGIKINCLGGPGIYTSKEVVKAIIKGLRLGGIPVENIIIWDRTEEDLRRCRYKINRDGSGVRCYGTLPSIGYEEQPTRMGEFEGKLSKILTQTITALINAPILKDHNLSGFTGTMKNHYGSFENPQDYHANTCDPYIANLNSIPLIKKKLVYWSTMPSVHWQMADPSTMPVSDGITMAY